MEVAKRSILMALIGGVSHYVDNNPSQRTRGDLHLLLLGDPGTSKSQLLKHVQNISPRCVFTSGKGASAAGLTVAVKRSAQTGEFYLQAGALVLANGGTCIIDELDKMSEVDRTALHQAMEQQTVSVAKAGIIASLEARASVIAAANPISGQYLTSVGVANNLNIGDALLSRFDLVCVIKDVVDVDRDRQMSRFVTEQHARGHPYYEDALQTRTQVVEELARLRTEILRLGGEEALRRATAPQAGAPGASGEGGTGGATSAPAGDGQASEPALSPATPEIVDDGTPLAQKIRDYQALESLHKRVDETFVRLLGDYARDVVGGENLALVNSLPGRLSATEVADYVSRSATPDLILPQDFLRRYIFYARQFEPVLERPLIEQVKNFYNRVRSLSSAGGSPVTNRQIGTLFRISEAHAKMRLSRRVEGRDVSFAIRLFTDLYIPQQKAAVQRRIEGQLRQLTTTQADVFSAIMSVLYDIVHAYYRHSISQGQPVDRIRVSITALQNECLMCNLHLSEAFFRSAPFLENYQLELNEAGEPVAVVKVYD